tara:strand:+ start:14 stop:751 length:738 start_codon:yes stop_codon:yes gene_type:complete
MQKIIIFLINFFDFFHKRKIINFLKKENFNEYEIIFDIGAHKGESIDFFLNNFNVKKIISFEASPINFEFLKTKKKKLDEKFKNSKIVIENIGLGSINETKPLKQFYESSSTTFSEINEDSKYFKKKFNIINPFRNKKIYNEIQINLETLDEYIKKNNFEFINLIKIDTEGFEYDILKGLKDNINNIHLILFEHHYDNMIKKKYTFSDINELLVKKNFFMIYKAKMPLRRTFEYIYINKSFKKNF